VLLGYYWSYYTQATTRRPDLGQAVELRIRPFSIISLYELARKREMTDIIWMEDD
jgi:hypothetical protein